MDDADEQWAKDNPEEAEKQGIPPKAFLKQHPLALEKV